MTSNRVIAVDIGNSAMKFASRGIAANTSMTRIDAEQLSEFERLCKPLPAGSVEWRIGSVHQRAAQQLTGRIRQVRPQDLIRVIRAADLKITAAVDDADGVGIDRLSAAAAVARLHLGPTVIIDAGTAITVDLLLPPDRFVGGAILPGVQLQLSSLSRGTDGLPSVQLPPSAPDVIGGNTTAAIQSGVFWGVVGAVSQVVEQIRRAHKLDAVVVTGGDGERIARHLAFDTMLEPRLVLDGLLNAVTC